MHEVTNQHYDKLKFFDSLFAINININIYIYINYMKILKIPLDLLMKMKYTYLKPGCGACPVRYSGLSAEGFCGYKGMLLENFI